MIRTFLCFGIAALVLDVAFRAGAASIDRPGDAVDTLDIVIFSDKEFAPGVAAIIQAVREYSSLPARFYVGYEGRSRGLASFLKCLRVDLEGVEVRNTAPLVSSLGKSTESKFNRLASSAANFARFTVLETFPELEASLAAWVLDPDTLPIGDLAGPVSAFVQSGALLGAARRHDGLTFQRVAQGSPNYMSPLVYSKYQERYGGRRYPEASQPWNAGAYLANYHKWREVGVAREARWWYEQNQAHSLWQLGSQPLMHIIFGHDTLLLDAAYNCQLVREKLVRRSGKLWQPYPTDQQPKAAGETSASTTARACQVVHWNGLGVKVWRPTAPAYYAKLPQKPLLETAMAEWRRVVDPRAARSCAAHA